MHSQIIWAFALLCLVVWVSYSMTCPFGWQSPLTVSHRYLIYLNGARYEILLVKWRRKMVRNIATLMGEIAKNHYTFARESDMVVLSEEINIPSGISIYSKLPSGRIVVIDSFHKKQYHVRRDTDFILMGDYDVYAIVPQELANTHEPVTKHFIATKEATTVA